MADLYDLVAQHNRDLEAVDRQAATRMMTGYKTALVSLQGEIDGFTARIAEARAAGEDVQPGWLFRQARYRSLMAQVETELTRWTTAAAGTTTMAQRQALASADAHLQGEITAAMGNAPPGVQAPAFDHLPVRTIEQMVGFASDGTPLSRLFGTLNPLGAQAARNALVTGLTLGRPVAQIGTGIREAMGVPLWRGLLIARTETHRAYREAKRIGITENADALEGWVWHSARTARVCSACWSREGTFYPIETVDRISGGQRVRVSEVAGMATHPACRCTLSPRAKSYADIVGDPSLPDSRPPIVNGEDAFARLTPAQRLQVLGPGKAALYEAGQIRLSDLVQRTQSADWGPGIRETTLGELIQAHGLLERKTA